MSLGVPVVAVGLLLALYYVGRLLWEQGWPVLAISAPAVVVAGLVWVLLPDFTMPMSATESELAAAVASTERREAVVLGALLISLIGVLFGLIQLAMAWRRARRK